MWLFRHVNVMSYKCSVMSTEVAPNRWEGAGWRNLMHESCLRPRGPTLVRSPVVLQVDGVPLINLDSNGKYFFQTKTSSLAWSSKTAATAHLQGRKVESQLNLVYLTSFLVILRYIEYPWVSWVSLIPHDENLKCSAIRLLTGDEHKVLGAQPLLKEGHKCWKHGGMRSALLQGQQVQVLDAQSQVG